MAADDPNTESSILPSRFGGLDGWALRCRGAVLHLAAQGAQVLSYRPAGERDVVWMSELASGTPGQSQRGGIPVCWPWFGAFERNPDRVRNDFIPQVDMPAHGLARPLMWTLLSSSVEEEQVRMRLGCALEGPPLKGALRAELDLCLSDRLSIGLTTHNASQETRYLSAALHTYFSISDITQIRLEGLQDCPFFDAVDNWSRKTEEALVRIEAETDRVYLGLERPVHLIDAGWQRRIVLQADHSRSAVLWNPWVEKSRRLSEFSPDAWQRMVCIETARVLDDCLVLPPGASARFGLTVSCQPLGTLSPADG